jgi:hypothetical protein
MKFGNTRTATLLAAALAMVLAAPMHVASAQSSQQRSTWYVYFKIDSPYWDHSRIGVFLAQMHRDSELIAEVSASSATNGAPAVPSDDLSMTWHNLNELASDDIRKAVGVSVPASAGLTDAQVAAMFDALKRGLEHRIGRAIVLEKEASRTEFTALQQNIAATESQLAEIDARRKELLERSIEHRLDPDDIRDQCLNLSNEIATIEAEIHEQTARRHATEAELARLRKTIGESVEKSPLTSQLAELVALREEALRRVEKLAAAGTASDGDLLHARDQMLQARIELSRQQAEIARQVGAELINRLTQDVVTLSIDINVGSAKLEHAKNRFAELQSRRTAVELLAGELSDIRIQHMRSDLEHLKTQREHLDGLFSGRVPPVKITFLNDRPIESTNVR